MIDLVYPTSASELLVHDVVRKVATRGCTTPAHDRDRGRHLEPLVGPVWRIGDDGDLIEVVTGRSASGAGVQYRSKKRAVEVGIGLNSVS